MPLNRGDQGRAVFFARENVATAAGDTLQTFACPPLCPFPKVRHPAVMFRAIACLLLVFLTLASARAQTSGNDKHGIDVFADKSQGRKVIHVVINKLDLLDSFSFWKQEGAIRREATETDFRSRPYTYAAGFALSGILPALHGPTSMLDTLSTQVFGEIIEPDAYGHAQKHKIFSFTFTKKIGDRIDWDGFEGESLQTVVPDFCFTPWFEQNYRRQPGGR